MDWRRRKILNFIHWSPRYTVHGRIWRFNKKVFYMPCCKLAHTYISIITFFCSPFWLFFNAESPSSSFFGKVYAYISAQKLSKFGCILYSYFQSRFYLGRMNIGLEDGGHTKVLSPQMLHCCNIYQGENFYAHKIENCTVSFFLLEMGIIHIVFENNFLSRFASFKASRRVIKLVVVVVLQNRASLKKKSICKKKVCAEEYTMRIRRRDWYSISISPSPLSFSSEITCHFNVSTCWRTAMHEWATPIEKDKRGKMRRSKSFFPSSWKSMPNFFLRVEPRKISLYPYTYDAMECILKCVDYSHSP